MKIDITKTLKNNTKLLDFKYLHYKSSYSIINNIKINTNPSRVHLCSFHQFEIKYEPLHYSILEIQFNRSDKYGSSFVRNFCLKSLKQLFGPTQYVDINVKWIDKKSGKNYEILLKKIIKIAKQHKKLMNVLTYQQIQLQLNQDEWI